MEGPSWSTWAESSDDARPSTLGGDASEVAIDARVADEEEESSDEEDDE